MDCDATGTLPCVASADRITLEFRYECDHHVTSSEEVVSQANCLPRRPQKQFRTIDCTVNMATRLHPYNSSTCSITAPRNTLRVVAVYKI